MEGQHRTLLLKHIYYLCTQDVTIGDLRDAAVRVESNVVTWVGRTQDLPAELQAADTVLELRDSVVIPGMICTHTHLFHSLFRGYAQDSTLTNWLATVYKGFAGLQVCT